MRRLADLLPPSISAVAVLAVLTGVGVALALGPPLPIAAGLLVGAVVASVFSPIGATAAVAAATPLIYHPIRLGESHFSLLELALLVGGVGLAFRVSIDALPRRLIAPLWILAGDWWITLAAALLIAAGGFSLLTVADPRHRPESLREFRVVILEPIAALVLTRWSLRHRGGGVLLVGLLGAGLAVAIVGIAQLVSGRGEVIGNGVGRATGPYPHPNNLALYLERIGLIAGAIALVDRRLRRIMLPVAIVVAAGVAATLSRGAMLAALAGGTLLLVIVRPRRGWRWFGAAAALTVGLFAATAGDRLLSTGATGATSSRELIWRSSLHMAGDYPVVGVGLDQFLYQYSPRYVVPAGWPERYTSHPHNLVLDFWLSLGVAGLVLLVYITFLCARQVFRLRQTAEHSERWGLAVAAAVMLAGGAAHGLVDNGFFLPDLAVLTWIAIGLIEIHPADRLWLLRSES